MDSERGPATSSLRDVRDAIVRFLQRSWPDCDSLRPRLLDPRPTDRAFVQAAISLQEEGLIMYEVLLIGAGPEPEIRDALLTRKGQLWRLDRPG